MTASFPAPFKTDLLVRFRIPATPIQKFRTEHHVHIAHEQQHVLVTIALVPDALGADAQSFRYANAGRCYQLNTKQFLFYYSFTHPSKTSHSTPAASNSPLSLHYSSAPAPGS